MAWDRVLAPLAALGGGLLPLIAGLDARFGGSASFSLPARIGALVVILVGYAFSSWALIENRYFSGVVRIQSERGHHVVSSGPYRWIRHPGYAGGLVAYWATPVLLESPLRGARAVSPAPGRVVTRGASPLPVPSRRIEAPATFCLLPSSYSM